MSRHQRAKQARYEDGKGNAETPVWGANALAQLGEPFGKELTNFNLEQVFQDGNGAVQGIVLISRFLLILNYLKKSETYLWHSFPDLGSVVRPKKDVRERKFQKTTK